MKKHGILNSDIASILSCLGHTDTIVICDAGLPIPSCVQRVDLAIRRGMPSFMDVLNEIANDMIIESITLAQEITTQNISVKAQIIALFNTIPVEYVSHEAFKTLTHNSKAIIRTGEASPYANIILKSGVFF